jgi:hypothetical protein
VCLAFLVHPLHGSTVANMPIRPIAIVLGLWVVVSVPVSLLVGRALKRLSLGPHEESSRTAPQPFPYSCFCGSLRGLEQKFAIRSYRPVGPRS